MDKGLIEKANKVLDMVISGVESGVKQMPALADEYLTYFMIEEVSDLFACLIWLIPVIICVTISFLMKKDKESGWEGPMFIAGLFTLLFITFSVIATVDIIKLKYTPKAYLIEKIRR